MDFLLSSLSLFLQLSKKLVEVPWNPCHWSCEFTCVSKITLSCFAFLEIYWSVLNFWKVCFHKMINEVEKKRYVWRKFPLLLCFEVNEKFCGKTANMFALSRKRKRFLKKSHHMLLSYFSTCDSRIFVFMHKSLELRMNERRDVSKNYLRARRHRLLSERLARTS